jgi:hypothetical protein
MWSRIVLVTVAQAGIGFLYPVIDQWAHGAGLVGGIVLGAVLSPNFRWTLWAGRVLALGMAAVTIFAVVQVSRTSIADSYVRAPWTSYNLEHVTVTAPANWKQPRDGVGELVDPDNLMILVGELTPTVDVAVTLEEWTAAGEKEIKAREFTHQAPAPDHVLLPPGWIGSERIGSIEDALGYTMRWRIAIGIKPLASGAAVMVRLYLPDSMAQQASGTFQAMIASIAPR